MKKIIILTLTVFTVLYFGCGEDTPTGTNTGSKHPNIDIKVGAMYQYTNDSLPPSGGQPQRTRIITKDTVLGKGTYQGYSNSWKILSINRDTTRSYPPGLEIRRDTLYISYDSSSGKFYQWGLTRIIDPSQTPQWNLVADFSLARGNQWQVGTAYGVTAYGKVASDTVIQTTANPSVTVKCYRIEMTATIISTIYLDYFLGYSPPSSPMNPSGRVRVRLRPYSFSNVQYWGFDQILETTRIP